jgi:mono/diheme cytochrome c family protein
MPRRLHSLSHTLIPLLAFGATAIQAVAQDGAFFERRIRPLLIEHCTECHGDDEKVLRGGLSLSNVGSILRGGDSGPVLVPGHPESSSLYIAITYADPEFEMPPSGRLTDEEIADVRVWIERGAEMPEAVALDDLPLTGESDEPYDWEVARSHWAYRPVELPETPQVADPDWCRNDIDAHVLKGLEQAGLQPAPEADSRTLVRRAYFDLIGLPPTPEEVEAFLADDAPDAWERLVDRLLASPHYGERWGRHWLDVARYADSNGLDENTAFGNAWRYRDWVVRSFNADQPYDEFVLEQVAGDLLPELGDRNQSIDRMIATGFLSLGPKVLAEPDKEKMQIDIVDEQLDVVGQAFLALTIGCARCHDHKFDPIMAQDYYAMAGILYSTRTMQSLNTVARVLERDLAPADEIERARIHAERTTKNHDGLEATLSSGSARLQQEWARHTSRAMLASARFTTTPEVREAEDFDASNLNINFENWGPGIGVLHTTRPDELQFVEYVITSAEAGRHELRIRYASAEERPLDLLVDGERVRGDVCKSATGSYLPEGMRWETIEFDLPAGSSTLRLERSGSVPHLDRLMVIGPGDATAFELESESISTSSGVPAALLRRWAIVLAAEPIFEPWRVLAGLGPDEFATRSPEAIASVRAITAPDRKPGPTGIGPRDAIFVRSVLEGPEPRDLAAFTERWQGMASLVLASWERHQATAKGDALKRLPDDGQEAYRLALIGPRGVLSVDVSMSELFEADIRARVDELEAERLALESSTPDPIEMGIVVEDAEPVDLPIFIRGDHTNKAAEVVTRGYLTVLGEALPGPAIPSGQSGRLQLAEWIIDPRNPLTPRVAVNRIWHGHFGRGIVATPSNFGIRGSGPSHPELLDWLAVNFMEQGWSIKELHRLIMKSSTYRMSGSGSKRAMELDPDNRLLWHQPPRRLEAEPIRDNILAVGGALDLEVGGSLLNSGNFGYVTNDQSNSNESYDSSRRALYLPVIRNDMYPLFSTFDYCDSSVPIDARASTVVSQQALFMLNSDLVGSQSQRLATRLLGEPSVGDDAARIVLAYEVCFTRPPEPREIERALEFLAKVKKASGIGRSLEWPPSMAESEILDPEIHAWRNFCQVLMSSNEFIYIQ